MRKLNVQNLNEMGEMCVNRKHILIVDIFIVCAVNFMDKCEMSTRNPYPYASV